MNQIRWGFIGPGTIAQNFADAINQALTNCLKKDKNLICYGLGINDPKRIFTPGKMYTGI